MAKLRSAYTSTSVMPLFPDVPSEGPLTEPPNLEGVTLMAVDTETYDPNLTEMGPGFLRGDARIAGVSIATEHDSWYFPMGHDRGNCEWDVKSWLQDTFCEPRKYVFCNAHYDIEALNSIGAVPDGSYSDVALTQALIDEEFKPGYSLDAISTWWCGKGKDESGLMLAAASLGAKTASEAKRVIAFLDGGSVAQYARIDAERTLQTYIKQQETVDNQDLGTVLELEENLIGLTWQMRRNGVPFNVRAAEQLREVYLCQEQEFQRELINITGMRINPNSGNDIARWCNRNDIKVPLTPAGNPSFDADWLMKQNHPVLSLIVQIRQYSKMRKDFIESWLQYQRHGVIHPRWMQTMMEEGGTRSGRMASANPNLQQVPIRDKVHGPVLRALFVGQNGWTKLDYQAQEIRIAVHFAATIKGRNVDTIVKKYHEDRHFDFHRFVANLAHIERTPAKTLALGSLYGMQPKKTVQSLGMEPAAAQQAYDDYFEAAPYFADLSQAATKRATERGYVKTFLGRVRRFKDKKMLHKSLNSIIQGTAADMAKQAMLNVYNEMGLVPLVAVHDELGYDTRDPDVAAQIAEIMETALPLKVPMLVEPSIGDNWNGTC